MTRPEFITAVKRMVNDISGSGWNPEQYSDSLNHAITFVSKTKIAKKDPSYIFDLGIINGQMVPDNFEMFAGNFPITIKDTGGQRQFFHSQSGTPVAKFYTRRPLVSDDVTEIPFNTTDLEALKTVSAIYLKNMYGMDTAKEEAKLSVLI